MELTGVINSILSVEEGTKNGKDWKKQNFVLDVPSKYPKQVCFTCFGKVVDALAYCKEGQSVVVGFDVSSREYNGRWFTEAGAYKIEKQKSDVPDSKQTITRKEKSDNDSQDLPF